jgi:lysophospholipase L1-like esterase
MRIVNGARHHNQSGAGGGSSLFPNRLGFIGDSIMERNHLMNTGGTVSLGQGVGEVNWAHAYHPYFEMDTWYDTSVPVRFAAGMNDGISGEDSSDLLTRLAPLVARRPSTVLVSIGTNDVLQSVAPATALANIQAICAFYLAQDIRVILATVRPFGVAGIPDADARLTILADLNTAIRSYAAATFNVTLWDAYAAYDDGSGRPKAGYLNADDVHLARTGAQFAGRDLASVIASVSWSSSDVPTGINLATNAALTGTGGVEGGRVTGDTATSWRFASSGAGTATAVNSKDGSDRQVVTFTPQAAGESAEAFLLSRSSGGVALTPGNWIKTHARVRLSAWDGWRGVMHQNMPTAGLANTSATAVIDAPNEQVLDIISPPHLVTAGVVSTSPVLRFDIDGTKVGGSGTAIIEHFGIYEVPDPRPSH